MGEKRDYRKGGRRNWQIAFIDETEYWSDEITGLLPEGAKIYGAYFYDPGIVVHCCSFERTIECWPLGSLIGGGAPTGWDALSDEIREKLLDSVEFGDSGDSVQYFGDGFLHLVADSGIRVTRAGTPRETNWSDAEEAIREAQSTNGYLDGVLTKLLANS